jgi:hypothetical protein
VAEQQRITEAEGRRGASAAPSPRARHSAANDNVPPERHIVGKLLVATVSFAATFGVALWWLA